LPVKELGISIIPASAPEVFTEDTPTVVLVRQVLGAIAQFEKASTVQGLALISMATPGVEQAAKVCIDIDVRGVRGRQKLPSSHMSKDRRLRISDCA